MDLATLIARMISDGYFGLLANNALAQFGIGPRAYLGATLLPERQVTENAYREYGIRYRTIIANDGTRYSAAQKKASGVILGDMMVELGHQDIAREFTAREYDALLALLRNNASMDAMARILDWADTMLVRALVELEEKQRWEALANASVVRVGDNGFAETVQYPNPTNHRATVATAWDNPAADPFADIGAMATLAASKGYTIGRIVTSRQVVSVMANNPNVKSRAGAALLQIDASATLGARYGRATLDGINDALGQDGLPTIETYDLQYNTSTGSGYFLPRGKMVLVAMTGQDETVIAEDSVRVIPSTVGYTAIGRAVGQSDPGRVLWLESYNNKPPRIEGEAYQTSLPVITDPEAVYVLSGLHA